MKVHWGLVKSIFTVNETLFAICYRFNPVYHVIAIGVDDDVVHLRLVDVDHAKLFGQTLGKLGFADGVTALHANLKKKIKGFTH